MTAQRTIYFILTTKTLSIFQSGTAIKYLAFLVAFLVQNSIFAIGDTLSQEQKFERIYFETAVNTAGRSSKRAFEVSDSLYTHAASELQKVKALMLTATLFQQEGEFNQAIVKAVEADKIASKNSLSDWEARIAGFLSSRYRYIGLYTQGEIYLSKGRRLGNRMKDPASKAVYLGMVEQESAYYDLEFEKFQNAIKSINQASDYFKNIPEGVNKIYFTASNEELLGRACIGMGEPRKALTHFQNALSLMKEIGQDDGTPTGLMNNGIGVSLMQLNQLDSAIFYLQIANEKAQSSNYLNLKAEVYKSLTAYYKLVEDYENYAKYNDKYLAAIKEIEDKKKEFLNLYVNEIETRGVELATNQSMLIALSVVLLAVLFGSIFFYQRSKKRNFVRFQAMLRELKDRSTNDEPIIIDNSLVELSSERKKLQISEAIEVKILEDLKKFEKGDKFTDKNMSLSALAALIGTNTKYLSYILNTHLEKDFNTYLNELRVKYIVLKMEKYPKYRTYKISYLAEESGFSSHSKFSAVFKTVTGFTPSVFLEYISKEQAI